MMTKTSEINKAFICFRLYRWSYFQYIFQSSSVNFTFHFSKDFGCRRPTAWEMNFSYTNLELRFLYLSSFPFSYPRVNYFSIFEDLRKSIQSRLISETKPFSGYSVYTVYWKQKVYCYSENDSEHAPPALAPNKF